MAPDRPPMLGVHMRLSWPSARAASTSPASVSAWAGADWLGALAGCAPAPGCPAGAPARGFAGGAAAGAVAVWAQAASSHRTSALVTITRALVVLCLLCRRPVN